MNTTFSYWTRRLRSIYQLYGRRLFIVDFLILISWLFRCISEGLVLIIRSAAGTIRWAGNVLYRIVAFFAYAATFFTRTVGRSAMRVTEVSLKTTEHATIQTAHVTKKVTFGGVRLGLTIIDFLGEGTINLFIMIFRGIRWVVQGICYVVAYAIHLIFIRPFLLLASIFSYITRSVLGSAHRTGDDTIGFVTSFHPIHPPQGWQRTLISFVIMSIVLIAPFTAVQSLRAMERVKVDTVTQAMSGVDAFSKAQDALLNKDVGSASTYFSESYSRFLEAEGALVSIPPFVFDLAQYIPGMGKEAAEGRKLLEAGKELSLAGQSLTTAFNPLVHIDELSSRSLLSVADTVQKSLSESLPHLQIASDLVESVDPSFLPEKQRELLVKAHHQLPMVVATAHDMSDALVVLHNALGADQKKRYLVILQNNTEIRPTGGFIGSFALIDIDRGVITSIEVPQGGSYDLQGQLAAHVISPDPIHLVNPQWQFQDANWFPDFPTSAKKLEWFFEKSGGSSVDGVIAINAKMGADILKLTGPIPMPAYNKTISADNFLLEIQKAVEIEYDRVENKPKKLISDLVPEVISRLSNTSSKDYDALLQMLVHSLSVSDIQVYLNDGPDQERLKHLGLGGHIKTSPRDYAMVVDSNIAGGKTDGVIHTKAHELVVVNDDGTIDVTTRLWREHTGVKGDLFTGVNNVDYMRMYVPEGSRLMSAQGFNAPDPSLFKNPPLDDKPDQDLMAIQGAVAYDPVGMYVNNEFGKTVFGNWVQTKPGQTSLVEIKYRLPFKIKDLVTSTGEYGYMLLLQRQSASVVNDYSVDVVLPSSYDMTWTLPKDMTLTDNTWHWTSASFEEDAVIAFQFHKR